MICRKDNSWKEGKKEAKQLQEVDQASIKWYTERSLQQETKIKHQFQLSEKI